MKGVAIPHYLPWHLAPIYVLAVAKYKHGSSIVELLSLVFSGISYDYGCGKLAR